MLRKLLLKTKALEECLHEFSSSRCRLGSQQRILLGRVTKGAFSSRRCRLTSEQKRPSKTIANVDLD